MSYNYTTVCSEAPCTRKTVKELKNTGSPKVYLLLTERAVMVGRILWWFQIARYIGYWEEGSELDSLLASINIASVEGHLQEGTPARRSPKWNIITGVWYSWYNSQIFTGCKMLIVDSLLEASMGTTELTCQILFSILYDWHCSISVKTIPCSSGAYNDLVIGVRIGGFAEHQRLFALQDEQMFKKYIYMYNTAWQVVWRGSMREGALSCRILYIK